MKKIMGDRRTAIHRVHQLIATSGEACVIRQLTTTTNNGPLITQAQFIVYRGIYHKMFLSFNIEGPSNHDRMRA